MNFLPNLEHLHCLKVKSTNLSYIFSQGRNISKSESKLRLNANKDNYPNSDDEIKILGFNARSYNANKTLFKTAILRKLIFSHSPDIFAPQVRRALGKTQKFPNHRLSELV